MSFGFTRRAKRLIFLVACCLLLSISSVAFAEADSTAISPLALRDQFSMRQVKDVMVYFRKMPGVDMAGIAALMQAGSGDQKPDEAHCAHMAEHMVFHYPVSNGVTLAYLINSGRPSGPSYYNGYTGLDSTEFWMAVPNPSAAPVLTSFLNSLFSHPLARDASWDAEIKRSSQEIDYMTSNEVSATLNRVKVNLLKGTSYEERLFETRLRDMKPEAISAFMKREYSPARLTLVVAGDWDEDDIVAAVERGLEGIAAGKPPATREVQISPAESSVLRLQSVEIPRILVGVGANSVAEGDRSAVLTLWTAVAARLQTMTIDGLEFQPRVLTTFPMKTASAAAFTFTSSGARDEEDLQPLGGEAARVIRGILADFASGNVAEEDLQFTPPEPDAGTKAAMDQLYARLPQSFLDASTVLTSLIPEMSSSFSFPTEDSLLVALRVAASKYLGEAETTVLIAIQDRSIPMVPLVVGVAAITGIGLFYFRWRKSRIAE